MATLSKQGHEIARFDYLTERQSYRSNGALLVNNGSGWKVAKKYTPEETARLAAQEERQLAWQPKERTDFVNEWCRLVPLAARFGFWKLFNEFFRSAANLRNRIEENGGLFGGVKLKLTDKELERLRSLYIAWCLVRETVVFAIIESATGITTMAQGPREFRQEVAQRVASFRGKGVKIRPASLVEIQVYTAAGNTIETPETVRQSYLSSRSQCYA